MPTQAEIEAAINEFLAKARGRLHFTHSDQNDTVGLREPIVAALEAAERVRSPEWTDIPISKDFEIQLHRDKIRYRHRQRSCRTEAGALLEFSWIDGTPEQSHK